MKTDYLVIFVSESNRLVDERVYQSESLSELKEWAIRYIEKNKYRWSDITKDSKFSFTVI